MQSVSAGLEVLKGLLTPLIAVITAYIAWQQWKANERRLVLDRYDRRLRVYKHVVSFISLACRDFKPPFSAVLSFGQEVAEADFLFGPEVAKYVRELIRRAIESEGAHKEYCDYTMVPPPGYDHNDVTSRMHEHSRWLASQHDAARDLFRPYLDISK